MSTQVVQDENPGQGHFVQMKYPIPGQFVQEEALRIDSRPMERLKCPSKSSRTKSLCTGTLLKIGQYPGNLSKTKHFGATAENPSGIIPKCPGKSSRTKTLGKGTLFKTSSQYPGDSSGTKDLGKTAGNLSGAIPKFQESRPGQGRCAQALC